MVIKMTWFGKKVDDKDNELLKRIEWAEQTAREARCKANGDHKWRLQRVYVEEGHTILYDGNNSIWQRFWYLEKRCLYCRKTVTVRAPFSPEDQKLLVDTLKITPSEGDANPTTPNTFFGTHLSEGDESPKTWQETNPGVPEPKWIPDGNNPGELKGENDG